MTILFSNNASAAIASSISTSATTIVLSAGAGDIFPNPGVGEYFYATLTDNSNNLEIIKVTARSGDTLTVQRGKDGTTARTYSAGSVLELRLTAAALADFQDQLNSPVNITITGINEPLGVINAGAATGMFFDASSYNVAYYTLAATNNFNFNVRGDSTTTLDSTMAVGQTRSISCIITVGAAVYSGQQLFVDGSPIGTYYPSGVVPVGIANALNVYTYAICKTAPATFFALASMTAYS